MDRSYELALNPSVGVCIPAPSIVYYNQTHACARARFYVYTADNPRTRNDVCYSNGRRLALDVCEVGVAATQPHSPTV